MKNQGRLLLVVWSQIVEGPDEERCDDGGEQSSLSIVSVRRKFVIAPNHDARDSRK